MVTFIVSQTIVIDVACGSSIEGVAGGNLSNIHGTLGESFMDGYFKQQGWEKLQGEVGRNGFDGLYVKREGKTIKRVMISESKFGDSPLKSACSAQQMTHAWTVCKLDALKESNDNKIRDLNKKIGAGKATVKDQEMLNQLEKERNDLKQIRKHIGEKGKPGKYGRRIFRTKVINGELNIIIRDVEEVNRQVIEKTPNLRAKIESGKAIEDIKLARAGDKPTRVISLKKPPVAGNDLEVYKTYFKDIENGLKKSKMSTIEAKNAVRELKAAYKSGTVIGSSGKNGQAAFLRERLMASLDGQITNETNFVVRNALRARKSMLIASAKMEGIIDSNALFQGMKRFKAKNIQRLYRHRTVKYVRGILTRGNKLLISIPKGVSTGLGAGLMSFAFDAGSASIDFARGQTFRPEFERKIADAAIVGSTIGAGTGVAVILGATPAGWVVIGIGVAGYFITDMAVQAWHKTQDRKYLTPQDLMIFGIKPKDTIPLNLGHWNRNTPLQFGNWSNE